MSIDAESTGTTGLVSTTNAADVIEDSKDVLADQGRSFWLAAFFLSEQARRDASLLYAVCRLVDDIADETDDTAVARVQLDKLRREIEGQRRPRPLIEQFLQMAARCDLDLRAVLELISGVESDLEQVRINDDEELLRYCYRVAGTVGLMMCAVLGVEDDDATAHAIDLGIAMQLTNICRDVREDAQNGRVYIPSQRLQAVGLSHEDLLSLPEDSGGLRGVVADLLERAEQYYESADRGMRYIPARSRLAIIVASRVYRAIGLRLRGKNHNVMAGRTVVPRWAKAYWLIRASIIWVVLSWPVGGVEQGHKTMLHRPLKGLPHVGAGELAADEQ